MKFLSVLPLVAGLLLVAPAPAFAHHGIIHEGCPTGQVFKAGDLTITGAYTRAMLPSAKVAGGYFSIANAGAAGDTLIGGKTEAAQKVEVHQMKMDGDMMKMAPVEGGLEIPAGGSVALTPGNYHLMLLGVETPFKQGACVQLTLSFAKAGDVPVVLTIGSIAADAPPEGEMAMPADGMKMDHEMAPAK